MADSLQSWINDANAYELLKTYKVDQKVQYQFVSNSKDFYISLLNRLFFTLKREERMTGVQKEKLIQLAKGLSVYSDKATADDFSGVSPYNNCLYIAAIYYLCGYNALSSLYMKQVERYLYANDSAKLLYSIMAGSLQYSRKESIICKLLSEYMALGDGECLLRIDGMLKAKIRANEYDSLNDFFDTHIALSVLHRFQTVNLWTVLKPYEGEDFWKEYISYNSERHIFALLPSQDDAVKKGVLKYQRSFSLKMPTSGGKTFLTELLIYQELKKTPEAKILYLAPLRSLSRELKDRFRDLSRKFRFDFRAVYGGCTATVEERTIEKAQLLVATPETFTMLESKMENFISVYTLVICDEGQLLEDKSRGTSYELLLTRLKRNPSTRFLFISAIIPNISDINQWLGGRAKEVGDSNHRPCKIRLAVAKKEQGHAIVNYADETANNLAIGVRDFLSMGQVSALNSTHKSFCCAVALKAMDAGMVMLYCSMKDGNRGCVAHVEEVLKLLDTHQYKAPATCISNSKLKEKVAEYVAYQLGKDYRLTKCIELGIVYHHGQMPQDLRELIEIAIARKAVNLVICTKTLSEGVNMPIKTAVLANITNPANGTYNKSLECRDLKNIVGRVGRAGQEAYGLVVVPINKNNFEPVEKVIRVLRGEEVEPAKGMLYYVVQKMQKKHLVSNAEVNVFLESEGVADAIDMFINLHKDNNELDDLNLEEIVTDSLAYYLGDDDTRQGVKNVFKSRYSCLKNSLGKEEYSRYLKTGLSLSDYNDLKRLFEGKTVDDFNLNSPVDKVWNHLVLGTIYSITSVKRTISQIKEAQLLYKIHNNLSLAEQILFGWLRGYQYVKIASDTGCTVEQAALYVDFIQKVVAVKSQSIVAYILDNYNIDNKLVELWPKMASRGVWSVEALNIIDSGMGDRTTANMLANYALANFNSLDDEGGLIAELKQNKVVDEYVMNSDIPVILKERWKDYLREVSVPPEGYSVQIR